MKVTTLLAVLIASLFVSPAAAQCIGWQQKQSASHPPAVEAMTFDGGFCLVMGGYQLGRPSPITPFIPWEWRGNSWTALVCSTFDSDIPPGSCSGPLGGPNQLAFDSLRDEVVLWSVNNTWVWKGGEWLHRYPVTIPAIRDEAEMAFDANRGVVVMFGGQGQTGYLQDTWEWNGVDWTLRSPATHPSARWGHMMAYDTARGVCVLFGGGIVGAVSDETWTWDGVDWTLHSPPISPPARAQGGMAFDSLRNVAVLVGGVDQNQISYGDTWEWDGAVWAEMSPQPPAPAVRSPAIAYDSKRGRVVMYWFGSVDTWEYPLSTPVRIKTQPVGGSYCLGDEVTLSVQADGTAPLSYQWRRGGKAIPGETAASLLIPAAYFTHEGAYSVVVTDACGSATSTAVNVRVCPGQNGCPSPADVNHDGALNGADIQLIVQALLGGI